MNRRINRRLRALVALTLLLIAGLAVPGGGVVASAAPAADAGGAMGAPDAGRGRPCAPWQVHPLTTGLGLVENLLDDGRGGLLLSQTEAGQVRRLAADGTVSTVVEGLYAPGGLARRGRSAYVTTGLTFESTGQGIPDGGIVRFDLRTGRHTTWATGLVGPNGLAILPDGSAVTTRPLSQAGVLSEVTRVPADDRTALEPFWSDLSGTNGAAMDPTGRWLYVSRMLAPRAEIWRIPVAHPERRRLVADLGVASTELLDDLTVTPDGTIYVAAWGSGKVYQVDPLTGATCEIASGLPEVTAVEPGRGHGFARGHLFVSSFGGTVYELSPPA